jgi:Rps23 Pro-64 3,4-dihydroxylase Tpa1-like proline 4-hydroxylase
MGRLEALLGQSIDTLSGLLADPQLGAPEKAEIALRLLNLALGSDEGDAPKASPPAPATPAAPQFLQTSAPAQPRQILLPRVVRIPGFLTPAQNRELFALAAQHQGSFVASGTTTNAEDYRRSRVLYATYFPAMFEAVRSRIIGVLPRVLAELDHGYFWLTEVEMQMTAHHDGGFYKIHDDSGAPVTATRELSYVYYFLKEPSKFSGGELRLYRTMLGSGSLERGDASETVAPQNNLIVFFDSRLMHEIMPVSCPSDAFEDGRFTLNGWLRR